MKETKFKVDYLSDKITEVVNKCGNLTLAICSADCAEHVLVYFEEKQPNDLRPRNAIKAGRAWVSGELKMTDARKAAFSSHASAREVSDDAATAVAHACGHAAATAHVATHAPHAATYAAKAIGYAKDDINEERTWQYNRLLELFNKHHA